VPASVSDLIRNWLSLDDVAVPDVQLKIARVVNQHAIDSAELEADLPMVSARLHDEVILELPLVAVEQHVDARIDMVIADRAECRDVRVPA
jgi:hypothetical protein